MYFLLLDKVFKFIGFHSSCMAYNYFSRVTYLSLHEMLWHKKYKKEKVKVSSKRLLLIKIMLEISYVLYDSNEHFRPIRCCLSFFALVTCAALAVGFYGNHDLHNGFVEFEKATDNINNIVMRAQEMTRYLRFCFALKWDKCP